MAMKPISSMSLPRIMLAATAAVSLLSLPAANALQQQAPPSSTPRNIRHSANSLVTSRPLLTTAAATPSPLFRRNHSISFVKRKKRLSNSNLHFSTANGSESPVDAEITAAAAAADASPKPPQRGGLLQSIDNVGLNLKPLAIRAHERSLEYSNAANDKSPTDDGESSANDAKKSQVKSILFSLQSCTLWTLYLFYRAYRGFFVILPAVFREVFRKLEESQVVVDAFGEDDDGFGGIEGGGVDVDANGNGNGKSQEPMRLRTRITISVLSSVLTLSYVISGALRVLGKFIQTFTSTTSVESSLEAAADEVVKNEDKLRKMK
ncbi:hypothetical protein ACHAXS_005904 [Conticribra weissflogii]